MQKSGLPKYVSYNLERIKGKLSSGQMCFLIPLMDSLKTEVVVIIYSKVVVVDNDAVV